MVFRAHPFETIYLFIFGVLLLNPCWLTDVYRRRQAFLLVYSIRKAAPNFSTKLNSLGKVTAFRKYFFVI
ncbi:MAG TPA: hypothetical protein DDZ91_01250 [Firmicutes bacterium]|nr:hypothetical protein [Bacillota bacterium]